MRLEFHSAKYDKPDAILIAAHTVPIGVSISICRTIRPNISIVMAQPTKRVAAVHVRLERNETVIIERRQVDVVFVSDLHDRNPARVESQPKRSVHGWRAENVGEDMPFAGVGGRESEPRRGLIRILPVFTPISCSTAQLRLLILF